MNTAKTIAMVSRAIEGLGPALVVPATRGTRAYNIYKCALDTAIATTVGGTVTKADIIDGHGIVWRVVTNVLKAGKSRTNAVTMGCFENGGIGSFANSPQELAERARIESASFPDVIISICTTVDRRVYVGVIKVPDILPNTARQSSSGSNTSPVWEFSSSDPNRWYTRLVNGKPTARWALHLGQSVAASAKAGNQVMNPYSHLWRWASMSTSRSSAGRD